MFELKVVFEPKWERELHQRPGSDGLAVADGDVLVHERSPRLVRLAGAIGALRWDVPLEAWPRVVVVDAADVFALPQLPGWRSGLVWSRRSAVEHRRRLNDGARRGLAGSCWRGVGAGTRRCAGWTG
ncbi:hypothetical protein [Amycolatopsis sp. FDAARGOS 1241]|uniref:hypothetical protein n=1 Tax=Amycolatopsis sp. FDAARGOS 1241 TaxID=2778070 RepID=UPI001950138A|nr:hypothetical protein [Amycolatopsis sp. FDAARGOS 1241]QRP48068.1 hypothetical protein I6J71_09370 [Amycolatopsis sp. FDAARGOS 1241]